VLVPVVVLSVVVEDVEVVEVPVSVKVVLVALHVSAGSLRSPMRQRGHGTWDIGTRYVQS
jgi:hypothetical protein